MSLKSKALQANIARYKVEVSIDPKYLLIQEVLSKYYGLADSVKTFLEELSHPYRNWRFIVKEARGYALNYLYLMVKHPRGVEAANLFVDIFIQAIESDAKPDVKVDATDNILLLLQTIANDTRSLDGSFLPVIDYACGRIQNTGKDDFFLFVKSYYSIQRLAISIKQHDSPPGTTIKAINLLLFRYLKRTYAYWLNERDPLEWFQWRTTDFKLPQGELELFFSRISHHRMQEMMDELQTITKSRDLSAKSVLDALLALFSFQQIVEIYSKLPQMLLKAGEKRRLGNQWKVIFLFHIMNTRGLSLIHEETLRDINRTLSWLIKNESGHYVRDLIDKTFVILKARNREFPITALNCILNMGKGVYRTDNSDLINFFISSVIDLGFQSPMIQGVGNDWQVKVNPAHIQNVRAWMELIELNPKWSVRLLSYLTIHLSLCGVYIKDTDLFPRDITRFLNSNIAPVFNLAKQLARLFPVYFNDIGAEGQLRDISTRLDELSNRRDILIHFLRKQSHVESSNRIMGLMESVLHFWHHRDKSVLESFVPPEIFAKIEDKGLHIDGVHLVMKSLSAGGIEIPTGLLSTAKERLDKVICKVSDTKEIDQERVQLIITFYRLLNHKYNLDSGEMTNHLARLKTENFPGLSRIEKVLALTKNTEKLSQLLDYLAFLKSIILSPEQYEVREDIYKKRHFTVDIPSTYGSYHERKFNALGLTFRLESLANVLFESLVDETNFQLITKATFFEIHSHLLLFDKALKLEGISSVEFGRQMDFLSHSLEVKEFTFTQYIDVFKGFSRSVKNIINDYFNNIHESNIDHILQQVQLEEILPKFLPQEEMLASERLHHRVSEMFFRDRITLSLGLQQLDLFLTRIFNILFRQSSKLPGDKLHLLLNYDPERTIMAIDKPSDRVNGIIYLGNKGLNIVSLKKFGLPVPAGAIITTEAFRCREIIDEFLPAKTSLLERITHEIKHMQKISGKRLGDPENPLLFSVRSGSAISQPGMMDTFLNVGMNEDIAAGLAQRTGNKWFAWDNYRRFLQCYGMSFGLQRNDFDAIIKAFKQRSGIEFKRYMPGEEMRRVALAYKQMILDAGIEVLEEPFEQIYMTIKEVFKSWDSSKAKAYRKIMGISDDWGTAATIQVMVYGNLSRQSGSGVFFTHNPNWSGDLLRLWGDFTIGNQGEDVVSGLVATLPITSAQQEIEMRESEITLETHFPHIFKELQRWANELVYRRGWGPQEMEFTFEGSAQKDLYLLQTRDMSIRERKRVAKFDLEDISADKFLGQGIAVSGGAMSGRVVFSLEEIEKWRRKEPKTGLILIRGDTVPDDIKEIYAADGLLTARGGVTSHAAVVAHRLEKKCVVGCRDLVCDEDEKKCYFDGVVINSGEFISIDGQDGSVYRGAIRVQKALWHEICSPGEEGYEKCETKLK